MKSCNNSTNNYLIVIEITLNNNYSRNNNRLQQITIDTMDN